MVIINPITSLCLTANQHSARVPASIWKWMRGIFCLVAIGIPVSCSPPTAPVTVAPAPAPEEKRVIVINSDQYFSKELLRAFTQRTGIEVTVVTVESTDEMQQLLRANPAGYDLLITEEAAITDLRERRLLLPLEAARLPQKANLDPKYLHQACDPEDAFSVPYLWGTTLLAYRKDHFPNPPEASVEMLFDPSLNGKISLLDERNECYMSMLMKLGVTPRAATAAQMEQASVLLKTLVEQRHARFGSDNDVKEHLLSGESSVAQMYSGDAALIAQENPNIAYFIPKEGATIWIDYFAIPRDTPRPNNAHLFINFMAEKENAALSSNDLRYASPNRAADPLIDPSLRNDRTIYPAEDVQARCFSIPSWTTDQQRAMNIGWKTVNEATISLTKDNAAGPAVIPALTTEPPPPDANPVPTPGP